ncbi:uncharacterized protein TNCV_636941 [Trichonephila clavipes]|nr:uncharacterized protein TNCV_636941 [Trichonephila clavipes]
MKFHIITLAVEAVCQCKEKVGLTLTERDFHTGTRLTSLLRLNMDYSHKTTGFNSAAVQLPPAQHHSNWRHRWIVVKSSTSNRRRNPICPSSRRLLMVQENTGNPSAGATCVWMTVDEAVG